MKKKLLTGVLTESFCRIDFLKELKFSLTNPPDKGYIKTFFAENSKRVLFKKFQPEIQQIA